MGHFKTPLRAWACDAVRDACSSRHGNGQQAAMRSNVQAGLCNSDRVGVCHLLHDTARRRIHIPKSLVWLSSQHANAKNIVPVVI